MVYLDSVIGIIVVMALYHFMAQIADAASLLPMIVSCAQWHTILMM
jgi:hypothetical protein